LARDNRRQCRRLGAPPSEFLHPKNLLAVRAALQLDVRGDAQVAGAVIRREPASPKDRFSFEEPVQAAGLEVEMALI
jgi:hypothetical protein